MASFNVSDLSVASTICVGKLSLAAHS